MGSDASVVAVSPRHLYLGAAGAVALGVAIREIFHLRARSSGLRDAKRLAELGLSSLPFAGRRHFWLATAALQFALGSLTEIGEGCPLCGHDVGAGIAGALLCALALSLAARALSKRLPSFAAALADFVLAEPDPQPARAVAPELAPVVVGHLLGYTRLFNRPPPRLQSSR